MTEIYFDGALSARRNARPKKSQKAGSQAITLGLGVAVLLSGAAVVASRLYQTSTPFFGNPASISGQPLPSQKFAPRNDRVAADDGREGRLDHPSVSIDGRSIFWLPAGTTRLRLDHAARFMLAPADNPTARLQPSGPSADMLAAYSQEFQPVAVASAMPAPSPDRFADAAPAPEQPIARRLAAIAQPDAANPPAAATSATSAPASEALYRLASLEPSNGSSASPGAESPVPLPAAPPPEAADAASQGNADGSLADAATTVVRSLPELVPVPDVRPKHTPADTPSKNSGGVALAYARPEPPSESSGGLLGGIFGHHGKLPGPGSGIAVYDIKSATVYLPNGDRLEAHSGLGNMRDNPRFVTAKNRGPTPPNVYNLVMRERRFHGVEAVRLLPADGNNKFGRVGLLAHTYMYRGAGGSDQSNGCIVFKNYHRFLTAFKQGKIKKMIVVPNMSKLPTYMASL